MINEVNIINQVISGNAGAYRLLVNTYKDLVYTLVIRIVRSREEAEEVTQDTFLKAYHALANFKNESKFSTWLFRIAYNTAISRTRKRIITTLTIDDFVIENFSENSVQENLEQIEENERIQLLKDTIDTLQPDEQLLINLYYFHKQSIEEICQITELSDSNVKVKLHRIRKKMYSLMNDQMNKLHVAQG